MKGGRKLVGIEPTSAAATAERLVCPQQRLRAGEGISATVDKTLSPRAPSSGIASRRRPRIRLVVLPIGALVRIWIDHRRPFTRS